MPGLGDDKLLGNLKRSCYPRSWECAGKVKGKGQTGRNPGCFDDVEIPIAFRDGGRPPEIPPFFLIVSFF